jgi:hypothetical protein
VRAANTAKEAGDPDSNTARDTAKFMSGTAAKNGDMLDIVVHQNVLLPDIIVSDVLKSDHLPVVFHILDTFRTRNRLASVEKFKDWEWFQSLASELILQRIQTNSGEDVDQAATLQLL